MTYADDDGVDDGGPGAGRLDDRALIGVEGPDWRSFLQGLITQDVETLAAGAVRYGALLSPQGRLLYDLFVWGGEAGAILDVDGGGRDALVARLNVYRLRAKVAITALEGAVLWAPPEGPGTPGAAVPPGVWAVDPRLGDLGRRGYSTAPDVARSAPATTEHEARRLTFGVGDVARDALADKAYAVEANLDLLVGVDFRKGCFVGQETTSRMKRRATVKTRLVPIRFEGESPAPGSEVLAGTLRAGEVRSGRPGRALAMMRIDRALGGELTVDGRPVRLDPPAWLAPALDEIAAERAG